MWRSTLNSMRFILTITCNDARYDDIKFIFYQSKQHARVEQQMQIAHWVADFEDLITWIEAKFRVRKNGWVNQKGDWFKR